MAQSKRRITFREEVWFRLRMSENLQMPLGARKILVRSVLRDKNTTNRYRSIAGKDVLFVHVPKTGGTSLAKALGVPYGHIPVSRYIAADKTKFENSFKCGFVRNPWDRLFSAYNYLKASVGINNSRDVRWAEQNLDQYRDFEEFVMDLRSDANWHRIRRWPHFRAQVDWLCMPGSQEVLLDFVGRFENLTTDLSRLADQLGIDVTLPHERKPQAYEAKKFTPAMVDVIGHRYQADIKILKYDAPV